LVDDVVALRGGRREQEGVEIDAFSVRIDGP
jgi:hypothetical protein